VGTFIVWILIIAVGGLWLLVHVVRTISISAEKGKGHNRCHFCRTRLRRTPDKIGYMPVCRKCGSDQPWAPKTT
jgi:hypothetical protein